jgi:pyridoxal/pyridoxine/pyridoxamine kinase
MLIPKNQRRPIKTFLVKSILTLNGGVPKSISSPELREEIINLMNNKINLEIFFIATGQLFSAEVYAEILFESQTKSSANRIAEDILKEIENILDESPLSKKDSRPIENKSFRENFLYITYGTNCRHRRRHSTKPV